jgi:tetratricopeptide (TPR) repeat protein
VRPKVPVTAVLTLAALLSAVVGLEALRRDRVPARPSGVDGAAPSVRSPGFVAKAALAYDAVASDIYWTRVVQQYGRTKLSTDPAKRYDFLFPLLDVTTTLDPNFEVAYRFGAVFLAEQYPGGAGRPDLAIALLQKGLQANPRKWQYAQDIAFVYYWWQHDYVQAAEWFRRAARMPLSPNWLAPMAAVSLTQGGDRGAARRLWQQVFNNTEADWLMDQARFRLVQLDALDQIDALQSLVRRFREARGTTPTVWGDLVALGWLRGVPVDPRGFPYTLDPGTGRVGLSSQSTLAPLPTTDAPPR